MKARHVIAIFFFLGIFGYINGYYDGKHAADRWYAKHQPVAATPRVITGIEEHDIRPLPHAPVILYALDARTCEWGYVDDQREGHMYKGPCEPNKKVKLIPPIKARTAAPVASLQEPKPSFEIHTGPVSNGINGFECNAPVASVEEPR